MCFKQILGQGGVRINTNIPALRTVRLVGQLQKALAQSMRRLSSGKRISEARDDAAGLAISEGLSAQVRGLRQIALGLNQSFGYLQTAEGVLSTQMEIVQRMKELAVQGANGTLSASDRDHLNTELQELLREFNRVSEQAEFNGTKLLDGSLSDLNLQAGTQSGDRISLALGDSRASAVFTHVSTFGLGTFSGLSTTTLPSSATVLLTDTSDYDGDGDNDLLWMDGKRFHVLNNDGTGNLSVLQTVQETESIMDYEVEDLNGDGRKDIVYMTGTEFKIYHQDASGQFSLAQTFKTDNITGDGLFSLRDQNGDGVLDVLETVGDIANAPAPVVYLGNGNGTFADNVQEYVGMTISGASGHTGSADVNGDGILDAYYIENGVRSFRYRLGNADGSYGNLTSVAAAAGFEWTNDLVDLTGDGILDIVAYNAATGVVSRRTGSSSGVFSANANIASFGPTYVLHALQDIDGDGDVDIMADNGGDSILSIRSNDGTGTFSVEPDITTVEGLSKVSAVDMNSDGILDLVVEGNEVALHFGLGDGSFGNAVVSAINYRQGGFNYEDVNGDGYKDFILNAPFLDVAYSVFLQNSDGEFSPSPSSAVGSDQEFYGNADFNGDSITDLFMFRNDDRSVLFYSQNTYQEETSALVEIQSQEDAANLLDVFDRALQKLSAERASIGATQARIESAIENSLLTVENLSQARSQLIDLDFAAETAEITRLQIIQQAQMSVLSQANISLQTILTLLR